MSVIMQIPDNHAGPVFTDLNMPPCNVVDISSSGSYTIPFSWCHEGFIGPNLRYIVPFQQTCICNESSLQPLNPNKNEPSTQNSTWAIVFPVRSIFCSSPGYFGTLILVPREVCLPINLGGETLLTRSSSNIWKIWINWLAFFGKKMAISLLGALLSMLATRDVVCSSSLRQRSVFNK